MVAWAEWNHGSENLRNKVSSKIKSSSFVINQWIERAWMEPCGYPYSKIYEWESHQNANTTIPNTETELVFCQSVNQSFFCKAHVRFSDVTLGSVPIEKYHQQNVLKESWWWCPFGLATITIVLRLSFAFTHRKARPNRLLSIWLNRTVIDLVVVVRFISFVCTMCLPALATNRQHLQIITRISTWTTAKPAHTIAVCSVCWLPFGNEIGWMCTFANQNDFWFGRAKAKATNIFDFLPARATENQFSCWADGVRFYPV